MPVARSKPVRPRHSLLMAVVDYHGVHALGTDNPVGVNISVATQCHATAEKATMKDDSQDNAFEQQNTVSVVGSAEIALFITIRLSVIPPTIGNSCFFGTNSHLI